MKVGIIGAGASGMMAAVTAAGCGAEVTVFEKNDRVGKKILATGNGKCNLGNLDFTVDKYYCEDRKKLENIFSRFSEKDTVDFFTGNGMMIREKNGYLYPYSGQASTVLDVFRKMLKRTGVLVITEAEISEVAFDRKNRVFLIKNKGRTCQFDRLILSCGGPAALKKKEGRTGFFIAKSFGHTLKDVVPGLVQLRSGDAFIRGMAGVRTQAALTLYGNDHKLSMEQGELQITDYGISGIPVFQFSREAAYALLKGSKVSVKIDFFPDYEENAFLSLVCRRFESMKDAALEEFLLGMANKKINMAMIKHAGLKPSDITGEIGLLRLKEFMMQFRNLTVHISEVNGMENAQVCAGGVSFNEVDENLQSLKQPGLYLTGELLDVDGKCGGYNLQWAWTSGYIAGKNASAAR